MEAIITDYEFPHVENEKRVFQEAGVELGIAQCATAEQVIAHCSDATALLVQWAPITREVIGKLKRCKVIVRYGIGVDNVDRVAAAEHGIAVCNVPDYATGEVADHAVAHALALSRQLTLVDRRFRDGTWNIVPDYPMPSCRDMRFITLGFGRIARAVLVRAQAFGFQTAAYDPFVTEEAFLEAGVEAVSQEEALAGADILSLHLPLDAGTKHVINAESLQKMKRSAILINTSRGGLIDTLALAQGLTEGTIFAAGLDVFEHEPLERDHPILQSPRTLLTSHLAWHSTSSVSRLQTMAAEEALRGIKGQPLASQVN